MNKNQIEGKVQKGAGDVKHPLDKAASKTCQAAESAGNGPFGLRANCSRGQRAAPASCRAWEG